MNYSETARKILLDNPGLDTWHLAEALRATFPALTHQEAQCKIAYARKPLKGRNHSPRAGAGRKPKSFYSSE